MRAISRELIGAVLEIFDLGESVNPRLMGKKSFIDFLSDFAPLPPSLTLSLYVCASLSLSLSLSVCFSLSLIHFRIEQVSIVLFGDSDLQNLKLSRCIFVTVRKFSGPSVTTLSNDLE